ncbi:hypothetical protein N8787_04565 [Opitutaceae bacterium]|nr:hypothetical protein [Candidatus Pelagisphaera phototrophica]MDA7640892.1 hypothetical protein [Opitutaceae bacterium]
MKFILDALNSDGARLPSEDAGASHIFESETKASPTGTSNPGRPR